MSLQPEAIAQFRGQLRGELIEPEDLRYDDRPQSLQRHDRPQAAADRAMRGCGRRHCRRLALPGTTY